MARLSWARRGTRRTVAAGTAAVPVPPPTAAIAIAPRPSQLAEPHSYPLFPLIAAAAMKGMKLPKKGNMDINPRNMQVRLACSKLCSMLAAAAAGQGAGPGGGYRSDHADAFHAAWWLASMQAALAHYCCMSPAQLLSHPPSPPRLPYLQQSIAQMSRMLPPHMLKMMGGPAALQSLVKQMEGKL